MSDSHPIVCKPTPWFLLRVVAVLTMFSVFAILFYMDGSTGYRDKNLQYALHATFKQASETWARMNADGGLTAEEWRAFAARQEVSLPADDSVLPAGLTRPLRWPEVLHDFDQVKPLDWNRLWLEYTKKHEMSASPPEKPYDAGKIFEQWVVFYFCVSLAAGAVFILVRTMGRSITADGDVLCAAGGQRVPYEDMKRLDLRKWDTKGLAFVEYEGPSGKGKLRIDGLTYGGFKQEQDEPAERLMQRIRSRFSGEILEYVAVDRPATAAHTDSDPA
jgi:hypothetical protein